MCSFFAEPMALRRAAAHVAKVSLIGRFPPELSGCRARSSFPEVSSSLLQLSRAFGRALDLSSSFPSLTLSIAQVLSLPFFFFRDLSFLSHSVCIFLLRVSSWTCGNRSSAAFRFPLRYPRIHQRAQKPNTRLQSERSSQLGGCK